MPRAAVVSLYPSVIEPRPEPAWRIARAAIEAARTHFEPSEKVLEAIDSLPKDLGSVARERWDSIGRKPVKTVRELPWGGTYDAIESSEPMREANADFFALLREVRAARFEIGTDDAEICFLATRLANFVERVGIAQGIGIGATLAEQYGLDAPHGKKLESTGIFRRFCDPAWWRRRMRAQFGQSIENTMRKRGLVCKTKAPYATDWCVARRRTQKAMLANTLKNAVATSSEGEQLNLLELAEHSNSNPKIRRTELMVRCRGFEDIAKEVGHTWTFATLTTPSAFHAVNYNREAHACYENPSFAGGSVRAGQAWQNKQWARCRAKLKRIHVEFYGFRVAEPHHDGTAHWHMLLFCAPHNLDTLKRVIREHWLAEYSDELGAAEHRVGFEDEDKAKPGSSATGYIAKYIAKNIDGHLVGEDYETGTDAADSSQRVEAWATCHRIRQFQQLGGPPVGLWRELRRLRDPVKDEHIEAARLTVGDVANERKADWALFVKEVGGIEAGRKTTIQVWQKTCQELNKYGEPRGEIVAGVQSAASKVETRVKRWVVQWWNGKGRPALPSGNIIGAQVGRILQGLPGPFWGFSFLRSFSYLGPVPITVRSENFLVSSEKAGTGAKKPEKLLRPVVAIEKPVPEPPKTGRHHAKPVKPPPGIVEGTADYWRWFKEAGLTAADMTRLRWLRA